MNVSELISIGLQASLTRFNKHTLYYDTKNT